MVLNIWVVSFFQDHWARYLDHLWMEALWRQDQDQSSPNAKRIPRLNQYSTETKLTQMMLNDFEPKAERGLPTSKSVHTSGNFMYPFYPLSCNLTSISLARIEFALTVPMISEPDSSQYGMPRSLSSSVNEIPLFNERFSLYSEGGSARFVSSG